MPIVDYLGWVALIITLAYTAVGLPVQIRRNFLHKSTKGLSLFTILLMCMTFMSWVVYAAMKTPLDWYIIVSNSIGALCACILLVQFYIYRNKS